MSVKKHQYIYPLRWCPGVLCRLMVLLTAWMLAGSQGYAADSVTLTMNYTVVQGTCSVSVGSDGAGTNGTLNFGDVSYTWNSADNWNQIKLTPFFVKLSQCSGAPDASTQPMLTITGATDTLTGNSINNAFMFVDNTNSTAKGFGFVIFNVASNPATSNAVANITSSQADNRRYIPIPGKGKNTAITSDTLVNLSAAVTCGNTCSVDGKINPALRAGNLVGAVTFNFVYH